MKNWLGTGSGSIAASSSKRCLFPQEQVDLTSSMMTGAPVVNGSDHLS